MMKVEKFIFVFGFLTLAFLGVVLTIYMHNNPKFSRGYCVPKGQMKWGPMQ